MPAGHALDCAEASMPRPCYLRMGVVAIDSSAGFELACLACSWSQVAGDCALAIHAARSHNRREDCGPDRALGIPAHALAAARNYVGRIPTLSQQEYAEEYLAWVLVGRPEGCYPRLRCYGLSLSAGQILAGTVERLLALPAPTPARRRR
jgi:hypothetical protein